MLVDETHNALNDHTDIEPLMDIATHFPRECQISLQEDLTPSNHIEANVETNLSNQVHPYEPPDETLLHLLFECPAVSPVRMSLQRTLQKHFNVSLTHPAEMLFSTPSMVAHGFPFTLLLATSLRQIWLTRCNRRFRNKKVHPKALLHSILHLFMIYCSSHLQSLKKANTKKSKQLLNTYIKTAKEAEILLFTNRGTPYLNPKFRETWLLVDHIHPP